MLEAFLLLSVTIVLWVNAVLIITDEKTHSVNAMIDARRKYER